MFPAELITEAFPFPEPNHRLNDDDTNVLNTCYWCMNTLYGQVFTMYKNSLSFRIHISLDLFVEQDSWELFSSSVCEEISRLLCKVKGHFKWFNSKIDLLSLIRENIFAFEKEENIKINEKKSSSAKLNKNKSDNLSKANYFKFKFNARRWK